MKAYGLLDRLAAAKIGRFKGIHRITADGDIQLAAWEYWRTTEGADHRLYFHPPDWPVRVWALSIQPAGVVWADAEIVRVTDCYVMVRYAGDTARLDRRKLWRTWASLAGRDLYLKPHRTARTSGR